MNSKIKFIYKREIHGESNIHRVDVSGAVGKRKNGSAPVLGGILNFINPKYKIGQKVMLLNFSYSTLVSVEEAFVEKTKKNVVQTNLGMFKYGTQCWTNNFNDPNFNGGVNYYGSSITNYYILPINEYKKLVKFREGNTKGIYKKDN